MKTILDAGVFTVTVVMMVTVGMELQTRHFVELARLKRLLLFLLLGPVVVLPALGYFLIKVMGLPPHLSAGILLIAACPVGDISNFYVLLARGNTALSVTADTLSCLLSAVTMWIAFRGYDALLPTPFEFAVPTASLVLRITLMAALPVVAGIALRRFAPALVAKIGNFMKNASVGGIGLLLIYILITQREQLAREWWQTSIAGTIFVVLALLCGLGFGRLFRLSARDRFTTGVVFAVRNVGLAMAVSITLLNRVDYAVFAAVYFLAEVPVFLTAVALHRRWSRGISAAPIASTIEPA